MKKKCLLLLILCLHGITYGQKEANNWFFGNRCGVSFNGAVPVSQTVGKLYSNEACAAISDFDGRLLFYTNGVTVWNGNHDVMANGTGLLGNTSTSQGAMIVRKPGSYTTYYIFTIDEEFGPDGFRYSVVDIALNNGLGALIEKNILITTPVAEKMEVIPHTDNIKYWVIVHGTGNKYLAYLVDSSGISLTPVTSLTGLLVSGLSLSGYGALKASPYGSKLASTTPWPIGKLEIFDFDRQTGQVSNNILIATGTNRNFNGIEFSPNGNLLYVSPTNTHNIDQFNVSASNIAQSLITIPTLPDVPLGMLQLGPDGKIYVCKIEQKSLGVITDPDMPGVNCNYIDQGLSLGMFRGYLGLPNIPIINYFTPAYILTDQCLQTQASFSIDTNIGYSNVLWDFGNGTTSALPSPAHTYTAPGTYTVTLSADTANGHVIRIMQVAISANTTPPPTIVTPQAFCGTSHGYTLSDIAISGTNVSWYAGPAGGALLPASTLLQNAGIYYASQTINNCESHRIPVQVQFTSTLPAHNYTALHCDDSNDNLEITDLTQYNPNLASNHTQYTFKYFTSLNAAENNDAGGVIPNFTSYEVTNGHKIYARVESSGGCYKVVVLSISLKPQIQFNLPDTIHKCKNKDLVVNAGNGFESYTWSSGQTTSTITIKSPGQFTVTGHVNYNGLTCTDSKQFTVVEHEPAQFIIESKDWTYDENQIVVTAIGTGSFEYSVNGVTYQQSNVFSGLTSGIYTIFINGNDGCDIYEEEIVLLMYPKFFTPNGDGNNDLWKVRFSQFEQGIETLIFDRYGKLITMLKNLDVWDGKANNTDLPASDYWFVVKRANGEVYKGHFSLLR